MRKITHIINPVIVGKASDLYYAQPITFESMKVARQFAAGRVEVDLLTTQYPEDRALLPEGFEMAPDLERSVLDVRTFEQKRKLPLVKDILDRLYDASTGADYLVFTNSDIAVMPYFYVAVNALIASGYDALVINRRAISEKHRRPAELALMYAEVGRKHEGHDCFVFRREVYPQFRLGNICVGMPYIGRVMVWNLYCFATRFDEIRRKHLTFHLGNPIMKWEKNKQFDYVLHNKAEAGKVLQELERACPAEVLKPMLSHYPLEFNIGEIAE